MRYLLLTGFGLLVAGCAREAWHAPLVLPPAPLDTVVVPAGTHIAKLKAHTVILQTGTGNTASTVGKAKAPVATGPNARAEQVQPPRPFPWWLLLVAGGLLLGNRLVRGRWLL